MEGELYEAAIAGDASELDRLIGADPDILTKVIAGYAKTDNLNKVIARGAETETPLHIAAQLGHIEFVRKFRTLQPDFARVKNTQGKCPLHLASAKGHVEVVAELLEMDSDVCFLRDKDGRTPLHIAAMKGRVEVLKKLAEKKTKAAWLLTDRGEPILHLCADHDMFGALEAIIECVKHNEREKLVEFVNMKDDDDNTILHLLAAKGKGQVIKFLLPKDPRINDFKVDVNAINVHGSTALDVFYHNFRILDRIRIKNLLGNQAKRAIDIPGSQLKIRRELVFHRKNELTSEMQNALMVVAILIATVSFQAQMSPPGGVWQDDGSITNKQQEFNKTIQQFQMKEVMVNYTAGKAIMSFNLSNNYSCFTTFNTVALTSSLMLILQLVSGWTYRGTSALTFCTWIALLSMFVVFCVSLNTLSPHNSFLPKSTPYHSREWLPPTVNLLALMGFIGWVMMIALVLTLYVITFFWANFLKGKIIDFWYKMTDSCSKTHASGITEGGNKMNA